jgi:SNF2 family DNA or RNA helicase
MTQVYRPHDYQQAITRHILDTGRCNVWSGMGTGKTVATLTAIDALLNVLGVDTRVLVVAPLRVAKTTWPDEVRKWHHLRQLTIAPAIGTPIERRAAVHSKAQIVTINYDNLAWLIEEIGVDNWPFGIVIADESTKLKNFRLRGQGTKRAGALGRVAHTMTSRFVNLTGTPAPNGLMDLWGQAWFVDAGVRLGRTFTAFKDRWFESGRPHPNAHYVEVRPRDYAQKQIEKALGDVTITVNAADYMDLPPLITNDIKVELPGELMAQYRELEKEMFLKIEEDEIEAANAAVLSMKCLQFANGALYTDEKNTAWAELHDLTIDALADVIEEAAGMPVLVAYHFKSDLARLKKAFPQGRELDAKPKTQADWNAGKIPILFAHPASAGHGLNLQDGGNILAYFGLWWNLEEHMQILERIGPTRQKQSGHNRPVFVHRIMVKGTVSELVALRLDSKRSVQDILLEAMKEKKIGHA